jgi:hypothetical protein
MVRTLNDSTVSGEDAGARRARPRPRRHGHFIFNFTNFKPTCQPGADAPTLSKHDARHVAQSFLSS